MTPAIFLDTNVFLDAILSRPPEHIAAQTILKACEAKQISGYTSSSNFVNLIFLLGRAGYSNRGIRITLNDLLKFVRIESPYEATLQAALASRFQDLEDAVQYHTALQLDPLDYFVTNNVRDFQTGAHLLHVVRPSELLRKISSL